MFNNKYTHISTVLEKLYRDYGLEVPKSDAMEYIWENIGLMGRPEILVSDVKDVEIYEYKGMLPVELYSFLGCREKSTKIPLLPTRGRYGLTNNNYTPNYDVFYSTYNKVEENGALVDDINTSLVSTGYSLSDFLTSEGNSQYKYNVVNNTIFTSIKQTVLEVAFLGFPVWEDGTPMIPEDQKILRAIVNYIAERVAFKMMLTDRLSERKWGYIRDEAQWATGSAMNYMKLPSVDVMEGIKNQTIRLFPKQYVWENGFENLNE